MIDIDLLSVQSQLKFKKEGNKTQIFDPLRKKWLLLQPEEFVRQCLILWLHTQADFPLRYMTVEKGIAVNGQTRRFDLLIYDKKFQPWMLVECKAPRTKLSNKTFEQVGHYNWFEANLRVPYLLITNGPDTLCCQINYESGTWEFLEELPSWKKD